MKPLVRKSSSRQGLDGWSARVVPIETELSAARNGVEMVSSARRFVVSVVLVLFALATAACGGNSNPSAGESGAAGDSPSATPSAGESGTPGDSPSATKVNIGITSGMTLAGVLVADELGYYEDEGLDATLVTFTSGGDMTSAVLSGDVAAAATGAERVLTIREKGEDLRLLMALTAVPTLTLVVDPDFVNFPTGNVSETMNSLKGARIGFAGFGGASEAMLDALLDRVGMTQEDFQLIETGLGPAQIAAANTGAVDAVWSIEPDTTTAVDTLGWKVAVDLTDPAQAGDLYSLIGLGLVTSAKWLNSDGNVETAKKIVRATGRAMEYIRTDPNAPSTMAKLYPPTSVDEMGRLIEKMSSGYHPTVTPEMTDGWNEVLRESGLITVTVPFEDFVATEMSDAWEGK